MTDKKSRRYQFTGEYGAVFHDLPHGPLYSVERDGKLLEEVEGSTLVAEPGDVIIVHPDADAPEYASLIEINSNKKPSTATADTNENEGTE